VIAPENDYAATVTGKIEAIKADMKKVNEAKQSSLTRNQDSTQQSVTQGLRFDGRGAWVNTQA
jgi:hypothetical protein